MTPLADFKSCGFIVGRGMLPAELRSLVRRYMDISHLAGRKVPGCPPAAHVPYEEYSAVLSETLLDSLRSTVEAETGFGLLPSYSFWRLHESGAALARHVDRPSCEVSVSIAVAVEPANFEWPLFLRDLRGQEVPIQLRPGDGVIYMGCEVPHWRTQFGGQLQYQMFLHYVRAHGPNAGYAYDGRPGLAMPHPLMVAERQA